MTRPMTEGAEILSRNQSMPLARRDVLWLRHDGYRWYCRYCEHPHRSRNSARHRPCCKRMKLDPI